MGSVCLNLLNLAVVFAVDLQNYFLKSPGILPGYITGKKMPNADATIPATKAAKTRINRRGTEAAPRAAPSFFRPSIMPLTIFLTHSADFLASCSVFFAEAIFCEVIAACLSIFQQSRGKELKCVYCNEPATEWDHFRPLISNKKPSGYMTDIYNLVPCCHLCNCSKGAKNWKDYLASKSKKSARARLTAKNLSHLIDKNGQLYKNLETFEKESDKKVHHIKISYDANDNITEIKWYKGNTLISAKDSRIVKEITDYYSKLDTIKQLLHDVTNDGNKLRNSIKQIVH